MHDSEEVRLKQIWPPAPVRRIQDLVSRSDDAIDDLVGLREGRSRCKTWCFQTMSSPGTIKILGKLRRAYNNSGYIKQAL